MLPLRLTPLAWALTILLAWPNACIAQSGEEASRFVLVIYPEASDGSPGSILADQSIRATFAADSTQRIEVHNEYLDISRFPDARSQQELAAFLRRKYAGRKIDLILTGLAPALNYTLEHREELFPKVPIVFFAVDLQALSGRQRDPDVIGAPTRFDLADTLELMLRLHPGTRQVYVVLGKARFDAYWEAEARKTFQPYRENVEFVYLAGLPMVELLDRLGQLPAHSAVFYLHVFEDGDGRIHVPARALEQVSAAANAPVYGHVDSYIGRGIVGGRVFSFEAEGRRAAQLGLRILAGEQAEGIGVQPTSENAYMFDARQLRRWNVSEARVPAGSILRYRQPSLWELYKWHITVLVSLCVIQMLLISGMVVQRLRRAQTERQLHASREVLQDLTGKLLGAQETERRRIARELHDDFGQSLALISVEIDLLRQRPPETTGQLDSQIAAMSTHVKQLSSSIHDLSHQLHPMKLEQLGLVAAVCGLCKELGQNFGLKIDFVEAQMPDEIPAEAALCLYRIAQEALRNVLKHSGAQHAAVELRGLAGVISLRVRDDGAGFDPQTAASRGGLGLASMRERLRLVNGEISIESQPGAGTQVDARVPLCAASSAKLDLCE